MRIAPDLTRELIGSPFLYRALRPEEVEAGFVLVPKTQGPFAARRSRGPSRKPEEVAALQRQWRERGCPSRGVSTTPHLDRARRYAHPGGVVVELDRALFDRNWIREYPLNDILARFPEDIPAPEDDEVILICELEGSFPKEVVRRILPVDIASPARARARREIEEKRSLYEPLQVSAAAPIEDTFAPA